MWRREEPIHTLFAESILIIGNPDAFRVPFSIIAKAYPASLILDKERPEKCERRIPGGGESKFNVIVAEPSYRGVPVVPFCPPMFFLPESGIGGGRSCLKITKTESFLFKKI